MEEIHTEKPSEQTDSVTRIMKRIRRRVERTRANPNLTPEERQEVFTLANLTAITLDRGNPYTIPFGKKLIELTNRLMAPEETLQEQKQPQ